MPLFSKPVDKKLVAIEFQDPPASVVVEKDQIKLKVFFNVNSQLLLKNKLYLVNLSVLDNSRTIDIDNSGLLSFDISKRNEAINAYSINEGKKLYKEIAKKNLDLTSVLDNTNPLSKKVYSPSYVRVMAQTTPQVLSQGLTEIEKSVLDLVSRMKQQPQLSFDVISSYQQTSTVEASSTIEFDKKLVAESCWIYADLVDKNGEIFQTEYSIIDLTELKKQASLTVSSPTIGIFYDSRLDTFGITSPNDTSLYKNDKFGFQEIASNGNVAYIPNAEGINIKASHNSLFQSGFKFSEIIIDNRRSLSQKSSGFTRSYQVSDGVTLYPKMINPKAVSVIFYAEDMTARSKPTAISDNLILSTGTINSCTHQGVVGRTYRYFYRSILNNGSTVDSSPEIVEVFPREDGVTLNVSTPQLSKQPIFDVSFNITTEIKSKKTDEVYSLLRSRGLEKFFDSYVTNGVFDINKLVTHVVYRTDMMTGVKEYMGIIKDGAFSDSKQSFLYKASNLVDGHDYEYDVYFVLTDPSTAFDSQTMTLKREELGSTYVVKSQKFRHSESIAKSTLFTARGLAEKFSKSILEFGVFAPSATTIAKFSTKESQESNANVVTSSVSELAARVEKIENKKRVVLSWRSPTKNVDYYVVSRSSARYHKVLGNCAASKSPFFLDYIDEFGEITYSITPVYLDSSIGSPTMISLEVTP